MTHTIPIGLDGPVPAGLLARDLLAQTGYDEAREVRSKVAWTRAIEGAVRDGSIYNPPRAREITASGVGDDDAGWRAYLSLRGHIQERLTQACERGDQACYNDFADSLASQVNTLLGRVGATASQRQAAQEVAEALEDKPSTWTRVKGWFGGDDDLDAAFKGRTTDPTAGLRLQKTSLLDDARAAANASDADAGDAFQAGTKSGKKAQGSISKATLLEQLAEAQRQCTLNNALSAQEWINPLTAVWNEVTGKDEDADAAFWCERVDSLRRQIAAIDGQAPQTPKESGSRGGKRNGGGTSWGGGSNTGGGTSWSSQGTYNQNGTVPAGPNGVPATGPGQCKPTVGDWVLGKLGFRSSCDSAPGAAQGTGQTKPTGIAGLVDQWFKNARQMALALLVVLVGMGVFAVYMSNKTAQIVVPAIAPAIPGVVQAVTSRPVSAVSGAVSDVAGAFGNAFAQPTTRGYQLPPGGYGYGNGGAR